MQHEAYVMASHFSELSVATTLVSPTGWRNTQITNLTSTIVMNIRFIIEIMGLSCIRISMLASVKYIELEGFGKYEVVVSGNGVLIGWLFELTFSEVVIGWPKLDSSVRC